MVLWKQTDMIYSWQFSGFFLFLKIKEASKKVTKQKNIGELEIWWRWRRNVIRIGSERALPIFPHYETSGNVIFMKMEQPTHVNFEAMYHRVTLIWFPKFQKCYFLYFSIYTNNVKIIICNFHENRQLRLLPKKTINRRKKVRETEEEREKERWKERKEPSSQILTSHI